MEKFVKIKSENRFAVITQAEFDNDPSLYDDRTERPVYLLKHHPEAGLSYWQTRYHVNELVKNSANGFDDFNLSDQKALATFASGDQNLIIAHYMSVHGVDAQTAAGMSVMSMSENVSKLAHDAKTLIIPSPRLFQIGVKYLTWVNPDGSIDSTQANNLTAAIQGFLTEFERYAILGLEYNDEREGVMDYFNSTNNYVGGGLENYTFSPNMIALYGSEANARNAMRAELDDLFVKGVY